MEESGAIPTPTRFRNPVTSLLVYLLDVSQEIVTLTEYYGKTQFRSAITNQAFFIQAIVLALIYSVVFLQIPRSADSFISVTGALYLLLTAFPFMANTQGFVLHDLVPIWAHDHLIGLHRLWTVYIVEIMLTHFRIFIATILFCSISYWMIGFDTSAFKWVICILAFQLTCLWYYLFGVLLSVSIWNLEITSLINLMFMAQCISCTGYMISLDTIPIYLEWYKDQSNKVHKRACFHQ